MRVSSARPFAGQRSRGPVRHCLGATADVVSTCGTSCPSRVHRLRGDTAHRESSPKRCAGARAVSKRSPKLARRGSISRCNDEGPCRKISKRRASRRRRHRSRFQRAHRLRIWSSAAHDASCETHLSPTCPSSRPLTRKQHLRRAGRREPRDGAPARSHNARRSRRASSRRERSTWRARWNPGRL